MSSEIHKYRETTSDKQDVLFNGEIKNFLKEKSLNKIELNKLDNQSVWNINDGSNDYYLVKDAPIPVGSALQVLDGGAKVVMQNNDVLKVQSDTASSADVWVSVVDAIST